MVRRCSNVTDPMANQLFKQAALRVGLARRVTLIQTDSRKIPMTTGILRPAVVIPDNWQTWSTERIRFVMLHELAHIQRRDVLFRLIARLSCVIYWFNPLTWYALHRMRIECELACDDHVIATGETASSYAAELIEIARLYQPARFAGGISMARSSKLEGRIVSILDAKRPHLPLNRQASRWLVTFTSCLVVLLASITLETSPAVALQPPQKKSDATAPEPAAVKPAPSPVDREAEVSEEDKAIDAIRLSRVNQFPPAGKFFPGSGSGAVCFIAWNESVQTELGINSDTARVIQLISFDFRRKKNAAQLQLQLSRSDHQLNELKDPSREELKRRKQEILATYERDVKQNDEEIKMQLIPRLKNALTASQFERLQQIAWQAYGSNDLTADQSLIESLELNKEQLDKLIAINEEYQQKESELIRQRMYLASHLELDRERDNKAVEVLTEQQKVKFAQLKGKPFNLELLMLMPAWTSVVGRGSFFSRPEYEGFISTLKNPDVQAELELSQDAMTKVEGISAQFTGAWRQAGGGVQQGSPPKALIPTTTRGLVSGSRRQSEAERKNAFAAKMDLWNATTASFQPQIKELLMPEQYSRLQQINWQLMGPMAFSDGELVQILTISKEQKDSIAEILSEYCAKIQELQLQRDIGPVPRDTTSEKLLELSKESEARINHQLTNAQLNQFATLKGKPFHLRLVMPNGGHQIFEPGLRGGVFSILGNDAMETDLGLSQDASARLNLIKESFETAWHNVGGGYRVVSVRLTTGSLLSSQVASMPPWEFGIDKTHSTETLNQSIAKKMELWNATIAKFQPQLQQTLTPEQYTRLKQITWQAMGTAAFSDAEIIQALGITDEQQNRIFSITEKSRATRKEMLREGAIGGDLSELEKKMRESAKEQDRAVNDVLTTAQREQFVTLKGKPFDVNLLLDPDQIQ